MPAAAFQTLTGMEASLIKMIITGLRYARRSSTGKMYRAGLSGYPCVREAV